MLLVGERRRSRWHPDAIRRERQRAIQHREEFVSVHVDLDRS